MRDIYSTLSLRIGYPLFDLVRGRRLTSRYAELILNEKRDRNDLEQIQLRRLTQIVTHAANSTPYYRERIRDHISLPMRNVQEIDSLPILRKQDIQENFDSIVSSAFPRRSLTPGRTGGSTGAPTYFFHDSRALDYIRAATLRNLSWAGYQVGQKVVKVSGSHFDHSLAKKASVRFATTLLRQRWLPAIELNDAAIDEQLRRLRKWQPDYFWGYASAVHAIALRLLERGHVFPVRAVITSSDNLTEAMRQAISRAFECEVFNAYGTREMSIGSECEQHRGLHLNSDVVHLEVVDEAGRPAAPGQTGRILVTDLVNYAFPFLRYEIGDRGTLSPDTCTCGRPFPLLASLDGRSDDFVIKADGTKIAAPAFTVLMSDFRSLKDYRIHQHRDQSVDVWLVRDTSWSENDDRHLRLGLGAILGDLPYSVQVTDTINYGESGKRRAVVSDCGRV